MSSREEINKFSLEIEELSKEKGTSLMESILLYCDRTGFEIESAAKLLSGALKAKLQIEAEELHYLPKSETRKLPI